MNADSALHSCMKYYIKRALHTRKCFVALPIFLLIIHIGIDVDISTGIAKCRAIVVVCTADLLAHALLVNMKSFSGEYSCPTCTDRGQYKWDNGNTLHRVWPIDTPASLRTDESVRMNIRHGVSTGKAVSYKAYCKSLFE